MFARNNSVPKEKKAEAPKPTQQQEQQKATRSETPDDFKHLEAMVNSLGVDDDEELRRLAAKNQQQQQLQQHKKTEAMNVQQFVNAASTGGTQQQSAHAMTLDALLNATSKQNAAHNNVAGAKPADSILTQAAAIAQQQQLALQKVQSCFLSQPLNTTHRFSSKRMRRPKRHLQHPPLSKCHNSTTVHSCALTNGRRSFFFIKR